MNFFLESLQLAFWIVLDGCRERTFRKMSELQNQPRKQQLGLALCSLGFATPFVVYLLLPGCEPVLRLFSGLTEGATPSEWVFWLAGRGLFSLLLGVLMGGLLRLSSRVSGVSYFIAGSLLLVGMVSLATALSIFIGDFIVGSAESYWRYKQKEFRLRSLLAIAFGLGGVLLLQVALNIGYYSRWTNYWLWGILVFLFLLVETVTSLLFFHFYYAQTQKLTKV